MIMEKTMPFLLRRGPDSFGEKQIQCSPSSNDCCFVHLVAVVLHLRGERIVKQPVEDSCGNILAWNGEIFDGLEVATHESDTTALLRNLSTSDNNHIDSVLRTLSHVRGPWAFVYYQAKQGTIWFGRDYFGRRSLLWHLPSSPTDLFALSSVGTRAAENTGEQFWAEVPATGIYSVDIKKLGRYFSKGGENTIKFEDALQRYPWQKYSSPEYPIGPVRNQFNREISDNSACSTFCTFQKDVNTSTKSKGINVNCAESRTSDDSSSLQKDTACDSQVHIIPAIGVNSQVANCCQLMSARHEGINVDSYSDHTEKQEVFPCPVKEADSHTVHSSELSSNSDDAGDRCEQPSPFSLAEETNQAEEEDVTEGHVNEDVVEQFANVLMEAVRRRVFNLPRITETCTTSGKLQDNVTDDDKETVVGVGNKTRSNVGILFSGGLDSIVLAALADRCVPSGEPIDLINVAFERTNAGKQVRQRGKQRDHKGQNDDQKCKSDFEVPDRITGRSGVNELKQINPKRTWNFVEVNVKLEELQRERSNYVTHLVSPQSTVLDDSIGCALWFAARGHGTLTCSECIEDKEEQLCRCHPSYTSSAKVLLVGMGADEQLGGYARHRSRFNKEGWEGLVDEIEMEVNRISERNLGRDDRCISDHGRECRYPFLDEDVVSFLNALPVWIKCDPRLPRGIGEKILLRQVAKSLGLTGSTELPKRAIQFGSRIAKLESSSEKGSEKCSRF